MTFETGSRCREACCLAVQRSHWRNSPSGVPRVSSTVVPCVQKQRISPKMNTFEDGSLFKLFMAHPQKTGNHGYEQGSISGSSGWFPVYGPRNGRRIWYDHPGSTQDVRPIVVEWIISTIKQGKSGILKHQEPLICPCWMYQLSFAIMNYYILLSITLRSTTSKARYLPPSTIALHPMVIHGWTSAPSC